MRECESVSARECESVNARECESVSLSVCRHELTGHVREGAVPVPQRYEAEEVEWWWDG